MKASVVMAVYNGGERMRRTIESVLAQTEKDFEFICIDDGSTDGISIAILDEYAEKDPRMVVVHRENRGVCDTLNECHEMAQAEFIARTDQDDVMHPQLLEYCLKAVEENGLDFLAFRYAKINPGVPCEFGDVFAGPSLLKTWDIDSKRQDPAGYCASLGRVHTDTWSHFVRKSLFQNHPIHPEWGLTSPFLRIRDAKRWGMSDAVLYYYDPGVPTSMMHKPITMQNLKYDMADIDHLLDAYEPERAIGDPYGEWERLVRAYVIHRMKSTLNKIRRAKGVISETQRRTLFEAFTDALRNVFLVRGVPINYARLRHRLSYWYLLMRYRKKGNIK